MLRELQQEHDKLRKTLQAELPKGPKAMTSPKTPNKLSSSFDTSPSRPTSEQVPGPRMQTAFPTPIISRQFKVETHVTPHEMDRRHKVAPDHLFPTMLAAFEHVQEIVEREYKGTSHENGRPSSMSEIKGVNQGFMFLRRGDDQRIANSLSEKGRHKRRKTDEDFQANISHTYDNGRIGKRPSSSIPHYSIDPYTRTFNHPNPSPSTTWQTPTPMPRHSPLANRKSLGGTPIGGADVGSVSASEAFLKGYIEGQAKDQQQDMRWGIWSTAEV